MAGVGLYQLAPKGSSPRGGGAGGFDVESEELELLAPLEYELSAGTTPWLGLQQAPPRARGVSFGAAMDNSDLV